jgi:hypothetical protein
MLITVVPGLICTNFDITSHNSADERPDVSLSNDLLNDDSCKLDGSDLYSLCLDLKNVWQYPFQVDFQMLDGTIPSSL